MLSTVNYLVHWREVSLLIKKQGVSHKTSHQWTKYINLQCTKRGLYWSMVDKVDEIQLGRIKHSIIDEMISVGGE